MSKRYAYHPPGGGTSYEWSADHTFVKVSAADTGGQYTLMEDNLKANFALGLHLHRYHAETFYILEGYIDFFIDGDWITAAPNACIHIPPGIEHACCLADGCVSGRMLMIYQPSGFDGYLEELNAMSKADLEDTERMDALNAKYDIVNIGPLPERVKEVS